MAILNKTGITNGGTIQVEHITRTIDALSGVGTDTIIATGSFNGSLAGTATTASYTVTASFAISSSRSVSSSFAMTASLARQIFVGSPPTSSQGLIYVIESAPGVTADLYILVGGQTYRFESTEAI
jgi:hypothetical protein